jgi:hypothetical protein
MFAPSFLVTVFGILKISQTKWMTTTVLLKALSSSFSVIIL